MSKMKNIVILDAAITNPGDLSWERLASLGNLIIYPNTPYDKIVERAKDAHILISCKVVIDEPILAQLPQLEYIGVLATGYNNIDITAATQRNIPVTNAVGYSSPAVAQHVFALLLALTNRVGQHNTDVQQNGWAEANEWCYWKMPLVELSGKTMGIYGLGKIGQTVAQIANAFSMKVVATRKNPNKPTPTYIQLVDEKTLFQESDVLSLHAPLSAANQGIINTKTLALMKSSAYLINTGRGGLVNEIDLKEALQHGQIAGAGLDVLTQEPPPFDHPLLGLSNCIITPHHAWAAQASRQRLIDIVTDNVQAFLKGNLKNVVKG